MAFAEVCLKQVYNPVVTEILTVMTESVHGASCSVLRAYLVRGAWDTKTATFRPKGTLPAGTRHHRTYQARGPRHGALAAEVTRFPA
jgi:hypothetical protein